MLFDSRFVLRKGYLSTGDSRMIKANKGTQKNGRPKNVQSL